MQLLKTQDLPIVTILPELSLTLANNNTAILCAPPGTGKTTLVPLALADEPWLAGQKILMLEPRRLATRTAALRMSELLGCKLGDEVGYQVRFDRKINNKTKIEVITEGILTRRLQHDPSLFGVGLIIFDEFHERSLHADLGLALCLDLLALRDDIRILVMSATLEAEKLAKLMGNAPIVSVSTKHYPVDIYYEKRDPTSRTEESMAAKIDNVVQSHKGDILAFLPGSGEIRATELLLRKQLPKDIEIIPLYGNLSKESQDKAIRPQTCGFRRVVLATNIAETSLTISGVTIVVDSGLCRRPKFHPASGLTRLKTVRISKASSKQRAGRVGRTSPGICYRLWSETTQNGLQTATTPEIAEADLASLLLEIAIWGVTDATSLPWLDPPPAGAISQARELLQKIDALDDDGRVTAMGRKIAKLPVHPRLAHMILSAQTPSEKSLACDLSAILGERNPFKSNINYRSTDITDRLQLLNLFRQKGTKAVGVAGGDPTICANIEREVNQFRSMLKIDKNTKPKGNAGLLLAAAFPDRVAMQREGQRVRYLLSGGKGAKLREEDPMTSLKLLVIVELDAGDIEGRIYLAAGLDKKDFQNRFHNQIKQKDTVFWDSSQSRVMAQRQMKFGALMIKSSPLTNPDQDAVLIALLKGIKLLGLKCLSWSKEAKALQARVMLLRKEQPERGWPDLSDKKLLSTLSKWLGPYLVGITKLEQLNRINLITIFKDQLDWNTQKQLENDAPTHIFVPSGSKLRLEYNMDKPPVLAVRMQELFGLADTPTICSGKIPVTLHLLNPAQRPVQITRDLKGFWNTTWPQVKKELSGRYPKHHWPDNPWTAQATARTKRKNRQNI
ncbi:MAG: ATP-dependent helicase HrpB [Magnetococcales bacterium]|nr:ATP-dependent helicase HrpB [Magnetococcales bacterium]